MQLLNPRHITYKESTKLQTTQERYEAQFRNATLEGVAQRLRTGDPDAIVNYILERKASLRKFWQDENSFYVCRMAAGNPFSGEAPGQLVVAPAPRPVVDLSEVRGSGFDAIRAFLGQIEASSALHDLFVATSPSRTGDKSNVLLMGPPGSGKSECLRAVGSDTKSISVFAQGSDFLTCWKGEAEKNPKRLFEGALKLARESGKHVHILIDEIDTVLNRASGRDSFGGTNLTTEFQILMDGVVQYRNLSVWGATNFPERIPMAMIRRFNQVLVVGELTPEDRVGLLRHFVSFLPTVGITAEVLVPLAQRLEGATGDVIRKGIDILWRTTMSGFVKRCPDDAKALVAWLNESEAFDVAQMTPVRREALHAKLRPHVVLGPRDLETAIEQHLASAATQHEIRVAVETYKNAWKVAQL